jgi:quercetin dioxygenase-like cupin family protein
MEVQSYVIDALTAFDTENRVRLPLVKSDGLESDLVCYEPGQATPIHHHPRQDELFYVVSGHGAITFEGADPIPVGPTSMVFVPAHTAHGVQVDSRMVLLFFKGPGRRKFETPLNVPA